ncbi:MerR family transcriptional regulator [Neptuniibacter sp.]|uniref:MerR family transcriptional regulator n=1 Tax=Neptuniibacter sp. TaxID=1962643 RepID=UPI002612821C|nr:MerR family transcriptional regulator [Neptuniibacter sp.]MCP4597127.1 MerR family transcriptional regulator [Neptuniibacter sp.]
MYSIKVVEQESGIKAATLRKWEERYGFPEPVRSPNGSRAYTDTDLSKLKEVKKLLDQGLRPSKILSDSSYFNNEATRPLPDVFSEPVKKVYSAARRGDIATSLSLLKSYKSSLSTLEFAESICAPLAEMVGEGWACGDIPVHIEHALSEQLHTVLTIDQSCFFDSDSKTALLATLSNEHHTIGLKIANSIFNDAGCRTIYLGAGLPVSEIIEASKFYSVDYVGLSITTNTSPRVINDQLMLLREGLCQDTSIVIGGSGSSYLNQLPEGVKVISELSGIYDLLATKSYQIE